MNINNGALIFWLCPAFGQCGATLFPGVSEWTFGTLLFLGFWCKTAGILGILGSTGTVVATVTIIPFMPEGWDAAAGGFPATTGNVRFLMKDVVLRTVSLYLLRQDVQRSLFALRANPPAAESVSTIPTTTRKGRLMSTEQVDILILGSGQGGKLLAWHMGRLGKRTAVVERRWIGGSCPNIACMPSKNEIWSARVAHLAHHAGQFGVVAGPVETDMAAVRQRKVDMVNREIELHLQNYRATGAELIMGSGCFVAPKTIEVHLNDGGTRVLAGEKVFLNIGTHAAVPNVPGLKDARPLTHIEALDLDYLPSHLIVLGGGYVGLEMAQAYRRFGSRVTVIERSPRIMSREDPDIADEMQRMLGSGSIRFVLAAEVVGVRGRSGESACITVRTPSGEETLEGSDILVATGRIPNTGGIGLERAEVQLNERGYIRVNDRLETTAPDVWALGECAGSPQFTHVSVDDFRIIRDNLAGGSRTTSDRLLPYCVFTDPPLAHVGLSESEARAAGLTVRVGRLPMSNVLRTEATDETQGFMKVLVGTDDRILGFTMIGSEAGEVMAAVQTAMLAGLPYQRLRDAVIAHLTMAEGLGPLLANVPPR